jgi:hypothetical protein
MAPRTSAIESPAGIRPMPPATCAGASLQARNDITPTTTTMRKTMVAPTLKNSTFSTVW